MSNSVMDLLIMLISYLFIGLLVVIFNYSFLSSIIKAEDLSLTPVIKALCSVLLVFIFPYILIARFQVRRRALKKIDKITAIVSAHAEYMEIEQVRLYRKEVKRILIEETEGLGEVEELCKLDDIGSKIHSIGLSIRRMSKNKS